MTTTFGHRGLLKGKIWFLIIKVKHPWAGSKCALSLIWFARIFFLKRRKLLRIQSTKPTLKYRRNSYFIKPSCQIWRVGNLEHSVPYFEVKIACTLILCATIPNCNLNGAALFLCLRVYCCSLQGTITPNSLHLPYRNGKRRKEGRKPDSKSLLDYLGKMLQVLERFVLET